MQKSSAQTQPKRPAQSVRPQAETLAFIANYRPTGAKVKFVSEDEWEAIAPFVREAVSHLAWMAPHGIRAYLNAATRLGTWAHRQHLPIEARFLFDADVLALFASEQNAGSTDVMAYLYRLAKLVSPRSAVPGVPRPALNAPYTTDEVAALVGFAQAHSNTYRRTTLLAIIALGAGAGVVRSRMRDVTASSIHLHGESTFVRTSTGCAFVRVEYQSLLEEVCLLRPSDRLIGARQDRNLTTRAVSWVHGRVGVPNLNIDRLRATYVCSLIDSGASVGDVIGWAGVGTLGALDGYLEFCRLGQTSCDPEESK
jgi:hypothetical protein